MFNVHDYERNAFMLHGAERYCGYDWWWHSFTAQDAETGADQPFFIEFFVCNPALGGPKPVFGQLPENRAAGKRPSYLMVKVGAWGKNPCQLHRFFGWDEVRIHDGAPYWVQAGDCHASEFRLSGSVAVSQADAAAHPEWMCDAGSMRFDLHMDKQIAFNVGYGTSAPFRELETFAMFWHAEGMKTAFSGTVEFNGRRYVVTPEKSFGYADKNWGRDFTTPWLWLASSDLVSRKTGKRLEHSAFDIGGGRPKVYFVPIERRLLGVFCYEGKEYDFNFSHLWLNVKTEFSFTEGDELMTWGVRQENVHAVMETEIFCRRSEMLWIHYEAPNGERRHNRLWNGGNGWGTVKLYEKEHGKPVLIDTVDVGHVGCEYGEYTEKDTNEQAV